MIEPVCQKWKARSQVGEHWTSQESTILNSCQQPAEDIATARSEPGGIVGLRVGAEIGAAEGSGNGASVGVAVGFAVGKFVGLPADGKNGVQTASWH